MHWDWGQKVRCPGRRIMTPASAFGFRRGHKSSCVYHMHRMMITWLVIVTARFAFYFNASCQWRDSHTFCNKNICMLTCCCAVILLILLPPPLGKGAKYCDERICLSVCLSAPISQKLQCRTSPNFYTCLLWSWLDPPLPVLWMTSWFHMMGPMARHVYS